MTPEALRKADIQSQVHELINIAERQQDEIDWLKNDYLRFKSETIADIKKLREVNQQQTADHTKFLRPKTPKVEEKKTWWDKLLEGND